jgi:hypothetical protein
VEERVDTSGNEIENRVNGYCGQRKEVDSSQ